MIFLVGLVLYGGGVAALGGFAGTLVGTLLWIIDIARRSRTGAERVGVGCGMVMGCAGIGAVLGGGVGLYLFYQAFFGDGPPHGYPDRAAYRQAEMAAWATRLDPAVAALERFKAEHGKYPTELHELVTGGYLAALPEPTTKIDHLGSPDRVGGSVTYYLSPETDAFVLIASVYFNEDKRGTGQHFERWVYDSRNPGWQPGGVPPGWTGRRPEPPPPKPAGR